MAELNIVWVLVTIAIVVIGPGGGVYAVMKGSTMRIEEKFTTFVEQMKLDREETREWLKDVQLETSTNSKDIAVLEATTLKKEA